MADNTQQTPNIVTNTFNKGMVKDYNETFVGEGLWTHARNAVNNSHDGQLGVIGNEPANLHCINLPYDLIGVIHLTDDEWAMFTTDDINSEIGIFDESACSYRTIINDPCLGFKRSNLVTGAYRKRYDCERVIYWDDGLNPTRYMDIDNVPFICVDSKTGKTSENGLPLKRYKYIAASCLAKTAGSTLRFTDQNGVYQTKELLDGEIGEFVTYNPTKISMIDKACGAEQCYEHNVTLNIPDVGRQTRKLCISEKTARMMQYPNGKIDEEVKTENTDVPCACTEVLSSTVLPSAYKDVTPLLNTATSTGKQCSTRLDCEKIRITPFVTHPCISVNKGRIAGTLPNGSYQACIAYTIGEVRVTDYIGLSEVQSLFSHQNTSSALEITVSNIDTDFTQFELVIVSNINQQSVAKRIGYYSASVGTIYIDKWDPEYVTVPLSSIVLRTEPIEKSDSMYNVNNYLLRVGTYSKFKFNYQKQANKITPRWVAIEYPADYYAKGGNKVGYMRDEQYAFFIRWIYATGEKSESYHIPGRLSQPKDTQNIFGWDAFETGDGVTRYRWQVENTATVDTLNNTVLPDGGKIIATGQMGYWESAEKYPDDNFDVWGDLSNTPIRHHKFPDETVNTNLNIFGNSGTTITILGIKFDNITFPLDNYGNPITSVVGYEILRGSREGNKTILAKGLINNMREYTIPGQSGSSIKGLYQNYPYNDLRADSYITPEEQTGVNGSPDARSSRLSGYRKNVFSFHSPDTSFTNPYLTVNELKVYSEYSGTSTGRFIVPYKHPKFKVATDFTSIITKVIAVVAQINKIVGAVAGADMVMNLEGDSKIPMTSSLITPHRAEIASGYGFFAGVAGGIFYSNALGTPDPVSGALVASKRQVANSAITAANILVLAAMAPIQTAIMAEQLLKLAMAIIPTRQYAAQYISHGFYNKASLALEGDRRRKISESVYVRTGLQTFTSKYQVNNINRSGYLIIETATDLKNPIVTDDSRFLISEKRTNLYTNHTSNISSFYGAVKLPMVSQYGQLQYVKQYPVSTCVKYIAPLKDIKYSSDVLFGGDIYINRFTEKNTMFFFNTWLMGEPDEAEIDYSAYANIPYPRHWINTNSLAGGLFKLANDYRVLDYRSSATFHVDRGYFYLFNSGVRDFFTESEVNVAYRDWEDEISKLHYDHNSSTDLDYMFRSDIIRAGNYYKYDYSLSISKLFNSNISWGSLLPSDYNPLVAEKCYTYRPNRVIYSLPQFDESKQDAWKMFLVNNYKDFQSKVTAIKPVNKTGALFMMKYQSPLQFAGVEQMTLDASGTKVTIGDGGLFTGQQQLQAIVNADDSFEYGSCQSRFSTIGTPYGIFWVSQNQGKVYNYSGNLEEISKSGMKWWFSEYLPSELLKVYPLYPQDDNMVKGVGVQIMYDNTNEVLYISKRDYKPKSSAYIYDKSGTFYLVNADGSKSEISLRNENYFDNASWTMSYDCKTKAWISFHDWVPTFMIPGKAHFMSVALDSIWKHNIRRDLYCSFYNKDYPFEVEFVSATGQQVNSLRNIEYLLEVYKYHNGGRDKYHVLDENFDQAIIYNSEQVSGLLELEMKPKNNPAWLLDYPKINFSSITILFAKEENKYRFNQFWDITKDRGEFIWVNKPMFTTQPNGYEFDVNYDYVQYDKPMEERKKFRHNVNRVFLRKLLSTDKKFIFKISNQKLLSSPR